ncbi:MAG: TetR family transcriptional regulator [Desulfomonilaceae bacterium]|nr:TetR family transcriptional regulator [Desulfomonilaceae bacterium]
MPQERNPRQGKPRLLKIGQLSQESGIKKSLIHHYLNLGLLPKPLQAGLAVRLYDELHLARLKEIRRLRETANLPLARIKEILDARNWSLENHEDRALLQDDSLMSHRLDEEMDHPAIEVKRQQILKTATDLFSRRPYSEVRISDIADALHMGKSTFYVYFKNKEDLFMECIEQLRLVVVPPESWDEIIRETDFFRRMKKRVHAFVEAFSGYSGIINQARIVSGGEDPELAEKARESLKLLAWPLQRDVEKAQRAGTIREIDSALASYFLLALAESLGQWLQVDSRHTIEECLEILADFVAYGLAFHASAHQSVAHTSSSSWEVIDVKGVKTTVTDLRIDGNTELPARMGEAQVRVELDKICSLVRLGRETACTFEVTSKSGEKDNLEIGDDHMLTGRYHLGCFTIPSARVSEISMKG